MNPIPSLPNAHANRTNSNATASNYLDPEPRLLLRSIILFSLGALLQTVAYRDLAPILVGVTYLLTGILALTMLRARRYEKYVYVIIFCSCFLAAGVAAVYAQQLNDLGQLESDAGGFFELASSSQSNTANIDDLTELTVGAGAVVVWQLVYKLFSFIGFPKDAYIGISLNSAVVALSGVAGARATALVFNGDMVRTNRFVMLFCFCGLFWIFGAIHLRDAAVFFVITLLVLLWVKYLVSPAIGEFASVIVFTLAAIWALWFLRQQFISIPILIAIAGLAMRMLSGKGYALVTALVGITLAALFLAFFTEPIDEYFESISRGIEYYEEEFDVGGLSKAVIINLPAVFRIPMGSLYLFIYPIPVWNGFQFDSAYNLFKSFNAIFMYGLIPLLVLAARRLVSDWKLQSPAIAFLSVLALGFPPLVAATSLETRHFGALMVPILIVANIPDLAERSELLAYRRLLIAFLLLMGAVHVFWAVVKFRLLA